MQWSHKSKFEVRSCNHCRRRRAVSCTAGKEHSPCYAVIYGLSGSTIFFDIIT